MRPEVFFTKDFAKLELLFNLVVAKIQGKRIAIKTHFGEEHNLTFLPPKYVKVIYQRLKALGFHPNFIESNVLYQGQRTFAKSHQALAKKHGFNFAPIDIIDEKNADDCWKIVINKKHFKAIKAVKNLKKYDFLVVFSHFKGHLSTGFGGALKNIGMGLASRSGKLAMHANLAPVIHTSRCLACGRCIKNCPVQAISLKPAPTNNKSSALSAGGAIRAIRGFKAFINSKICIGCAECIAICPVQAPEPWSASNQVLQERMAEYAYGILKMRPAIFVTAILNVTPHCDCHNDQDKILIKKIGFLAATDPVAIDQAAYNLVKKVSRADLFKKVNGESGQRQLVYAEKLGIGRRRYRLVSLN